MAVISLLQVAHFLGSNMGSGMSQKVGLKWPPPPPISVRNLANLAGRPLQPTGLVLVCNVGAGYLVEYPPDSQSVPANANFVELSWRDAGVGSIREAKVWHATLKNVGTGRDLYDGDVEANKLVPPGVFFVASTSSPALEFDTSYSWNVVPFNDFGQGPGSPVFTFRTQSTPPPPPPTISVSSQGVGPSSVFTVTGSGFSPNTLVTIRVVNKSLDTETFSQTSDAHGNLTFRQSIPCTSKGPLYFSATDGRSNKADATGELWSNTVTTTCP